jgi:glycosyltransferase involved in cell wall biosynthesis
VSAAPSLVIASYNQPNSLALVFEGVLAQTLQVREVLVADDGSDDDTHELVDGFRERAPFPVFFTTQEDRGFRKASAQNNAIRETSGSLVLFLDGDCVPPREWAARYVAVLVGSDFAVAGAKYLSLDQSRELMVEGVGGGRVESYCTAADRRWFRGMHWRELVYKVIRKPRKPRIKGGNWAVTRDALLAVNGFDEKFDGFGKEDSDIRNRLRNSGFVGRSLWNTNWVYHCSHDIDPRRTRAEVLRHQPDREYFESRRHTKTCEHGIVRPEAVARPDATE